MELSTDKARMVLPESVSRADAVFNMQRSLWLVNAIANDRPEELHAAFEDKLHQPFRESLVPFLPAVLKAAQDAGAFGGFLSGAGSSVITVSDESHAELVGRAMVKALSECGGKGRSRVLLPDNRGLKIL
jgi:homoserine kinase